MPISVQKHSLKTCRDAIVFAEITQVNIVLLHSLRKSRGVRINLPYLYAFVIPKKSSIRIVERVFLLTLVVSALPDKFLPCFFLCFFFFVIFIRLSRLHQKRASTEAGRLS